MKKLISLVSVVMVLVCSSCSFSFSSNQKDLQEQINQLQQEVAVLQKMNGLAPSYVINNDSTTKPTQSNSQAKENDDIQTDQPATTGKEQQAIEAIKYCLKMYVPDLKYKAIRSVPKSDGTVDVIIDYVYIGSTEHTYYNVSVYSNNEFKVNRCRGVEGHFPHDSRFKIQ